METQNKKTIQWRMSVALGVGRRKMEHVLRPNLTINLKPQPNFIISDLIRSTPNLIPKSYSLINMHIFENIISCTIPPWWEFNQWYGQKKNCWQANWAFKAISLFKPQLLYAHSVYILLFWKGSYNKILNLLLHCSLLNIPNCMSHILHSKSSLSWVVAHGRACFYYKKLNETSRKWTRLSILARNFL